MSAAARTVTWAIILGCISISCAFPATGAAPAAPLLDIRQPSLSQALAELVRKTGVELLYDERLVGGLRAAPVRGRLPADRALAALLAGSGIGYRRTPDGAFVLFALSAGADAAPSDGAISELLVIGRRTQNVDIRRTENDIQAYKVATRRDIETAHSDNIEMFLRSREPANVEIRAPSQDLNAGSGSTRSVINLRGFGPQRTLVLVDGRRMPNLPTGQGEFDQGDLNAIPLEAIERIETLTSTSGGIHGPGAIGGVVNVILRRDYRGADLNVVAGLSDRGDAGRVRLEGRIGFTPDHGRTDVMVVLAHAASDRLRVGQRDFAEAARARAYANDPRRLCVARPGGQRRQRLRRREPGARPAVRRDPAGLHLHLPAGQLHRDDGGAECGPGRQQRQGGAVAAGRRQRDRALARGQSHGDLGSGERPQPAYGPYRGVRRRHVPAQRGPAGYGLLAHDVFDRRRRAQQPVFPRRSFSAFPCRSGVGA